MTSAPAPRIASQRIDKWLWHARIARTRTLAGTLVSSGKVRIDKRRVSRASKTVHPDNVITVPQGNRIRVLKVIGFSERRVSASLVLSLYQDLAPLAEPGAERSDAKPGAKLRKGRDAGSGRPTKKERRQTDRLMDFD